MSRASGSRAGGERRRAASGRGPTIPAPLSPTHPAALVASAVAAACIVISVSFRLWDPDVWEHLTFGKAIWALRAVPHHQIFTWPNYGAPLVNTSWGFSALIWPVWTWGGVPALFAWRWVTTVAIFALLWLTARRLGARGLTTLVAMATCALVYRQRSQIRPETLASVWFALMVWVLETRRQGGTDRTLGLPIVAWAWANTHISYFLGFILIGIHLIDAHVARRGSAPGPGRLWLVTGLMAALSFANPYGWHALARPFEYLFSWRRDPLVDVISELRPLDWRLNLTNGLPLLVAGWPILALARWRREGLDRVELLMCAVFTTLGLSSLRFLATYALAAAPYVARDLDALARHARRPRWMEPAWFRAGVASLACVAAGYHEWTHFQGPIQIGFDLRVTPHYACRFIAAHGVRGRAFNHFSLGGAMLWNFWPERGRLPFIDIHPEEAPPEIRASYYRAITDETGWPEAEARYHFDYALLSRRYTQTYGIADVLDRRPDWALVFVDDVAALYVRRTGPLAAVADSFGYRLLTGGKLGMPALVERAIASPEMRAALVGELERQAEASPMNSYGRQMLRVVTGVGGR